MSIRLVVFVLCAMFLAAEAGQAARRQAPRPAAERNAASGKTFYAGLSGEGAFRADMARAAGRGVIVVAPAGGMGTAERSKLLGLAAEMGLVFPAQAVAPGVVPYTANSDAVRLQLLNRALADSGSRIIWSLRGGYGSGRLLQGLSRMQRPEREKIFVGYSDMTFLHLFLQQWGWPTVHAGMFGEMLAPEKDPENFRRLARLLAGEVKELRYDGLQPFNAPARNTRQTLSGPVVGGNLACLAAAVGTPWALRASGKILFVEDIQEPGYKLDRLFTQLKDSGALTGVRAVILGDFVLCKDDAPFALRRFAEECGVPVFKAAGFGHGRSNYPLVFNVPASLGRSGNGFALTMDARELGR